MASMGGRSVSLLAPVNGAKARGNGSCEATEPACLQIADSFGMAKRWAGTKLWRSEKGDEEDANLKV